MPWTQVCKTDAIEKEGVIRFDHGDATFAVYRTDNDEFFCTDGLCTHENVHLCGGLVMDYEIECPKHGSVFDIRSGEVDNPPACIDLDTYPTKVEDGHVFIDI